MSIAADVGSSTGGRPASLFALNRNRGVLLLADIGATAMRNAVCNLRGEVLTEIDHGIDIAAGPHTGTQPGQPDFAELLAHSGHKRRQTYSASAWPCPAQSTSRPGASSVRRS